MTKKKVVLLIGLIAVVVLTVFLKRESSTPPSKSPPTDATLTEAPEVASPKREVIDQKRRPVDQAPKKVDFVNVPSADWQEKLESSLRAQGGEIIKEIKIERERSLIWIRDENPLYVESVVINLKDDQGAQSSFRALVDSETGKVLETWDQAIFESGNVREGFRLKPDPRYFD